MKVDTYEHRFTDIALDSDDSVKKEILDVVSLVELGMVTKPASSSELIQGLAKKRTRAKQAAINELLKAEFLQKDWEAETKVLNDPESDLTIDLWKENVAVNMAFNHGSFKLYDLLRFQTAAEAKNAIYAVYICPTKALVRTMSPDTPGSMANFERTKRYLDEFYSVFRMPMLLVGLSV